MAKGQMRSNKEKKKPKAEHNKKKKGSRRPLAVRFGARPEQGRDLRKEGIAEAASGALAPPSTARHRDLSRRRSCDVSRTRAHSAARTQLQAQVVQAGPYAASAWFSSLTAILHPLLAAPMLWI